MSAFAGILLAPTHLGLRLDRDNNRYQFYRSWAEYVLLFSVANSAEGIIIYRYECKPEALAEARLTAASPAAALDVDVQMFFSGATDKNMVSIS